LGSGDKKVTVIWDSGRELRYRAGENGKYDLRVFDTAPSGMKGEITLSYINCIHKTYITDRLVSILGHIILTPSQPVFDFVLTPNAAYLAEKQQIPILKGS
jgi:hypothetical protein